MTDHDKVMLGVGIAYFIADSIWKIAIEEKLRRLEEEAKRQPNQLR